jgi:FKBP-type peptidyl-prolyl cis-trans isomerase
MKYKNFYLGFIFISMLAITSAFFILNKNDDINLKEPVDIPLNATSDILGKSTTNSQQTEQNLNSNRGFAVQTSNQNQQSNMQNQLPAPSQFSVYEEYADSETALYIDTKVGDGKEALNGTDIAMLYKGYLTTGELFDQTKINSDNQLEAFGFKLGSGQVIAGWESTIPGMKVGGTRRLIIPAKLAYGEAGQGQIPPNSMLIFDVELVAVE